MLKNSGQKRRTWVIATVILVAAFIGLFAINVTRVAADGSAAKNATAQTANAGTEQAAEALSTGVATGSIVKMVSALVVVIFCIYFGIFLLKKLMGKRYGKRGGSNLLEVLETAYVGPKKTVSLVRVADRSVLIGVTDQSIAMLTELDAEQTADITTEQETAQKSESFTSFLTTAASKLKEIGSKGNQAVLEN